MLTREDALAGVAKYPISYTVLIFHVADSLPNSTLNHFDYSFFYIFIFIYIYLYIFMNLFIYLFRYLFTVSLTQVSLKLEVAG